MFELSLAIAWEVSFSEVDKGILRERGHAVLWIDYTPSILLYPQ